MGEQIILEASEHYVELDNYLEENKISRIFLVCDNAIKFLKIKYYFENLEKRKGISVILFDNFKPNPLYESVVEGVALFRKEKCDLIIAVGGGSAIDVAKCIKLYFNMDSSCNYLKQEIITNDTKLLAIPTTAGTGSEATRYAVIYYRGEKQSISDYSCIPSAVLMDPSALESLPEYHKKSTMMDALCHAIESFWSINSTDESKSYSKKAIQGVLANREGYLMNTSSGNMGMLYAANVAGKAINITQTTAGHAMSYKMTSLYGISHGHAASMCVLSLWQYMIEHMEKCTDPRGVKYLENTFKDIATAMSCTTVEKALDMFRKIQSGLLLEVPVPAPDDYDILVASVNPVRLKNNPIELDKAAINNLYHQIFQK